MLPTFPSRYWSTIGLSGVFSLAGWSPLFQTGFLVSRPTQGPFLYRQPCLYGGVTLYAPDFHPVPVRLTVSFERPYYPGTASTAPVWAISVSIATTPDIDSFFLFLRVLRCFSSPRLPRPKPVSGLQPDGLPHSDTDGSLPVCGSPSFFAAYHVLLRLRKPRLLLRLRKPRHPPSALLLFPRSRVLHSEIAVPNLFISP